MIVGSGAFIFVLPCLLFSLHILLVGFVVVIHSNLFLLFATDKVELIKQAMAGFSLPVSAVPEWAKHISEDAWKAELVQGLQTKQVKKK